MNPTTTNLSTTSPTTTAPGTGVADPVRRRTRVLFVGEPDQALPELAAALLRHRAGDLVEVETAGTRAGGPLEPGLVEALVAAGLDPDRADDPTPALTASALRRADRVVSLGRGVDVARLPGPRYETWDTAEIPAVVRGTAGTTPGQQVLTRRVDALAADLTAVAVVPADRSRRGRVRGLLRRIARR